MKVIKPAGQELSNELLELLGMVHAKRPLLEYHAAKSNSNQEITGVYVWQDGQKLGEIDTNFKRYSPSKGTNEKWIALRCRNIKKERGSKDVKFTKSTKSAARDVIELFTKMPLDKLGNGLAHRVHARLEDLYSTTQYLYNNSITASKQTLIPYFVEVLKGSNPPIPDAIKTQLEDPATVKKIENMQIAQNVFDHFKAGNGYVLHVMQDETLLCAKLTEIENTRKYASTFDLSEAQQEKFTMLKLLEHNQFAADIGIKMTIDDGNKAESIYFIVGGDTKTM